MYVCMYVYAYNTLYYTRLDYTIAEDRPALGKGQMYSICLVLVIVLAVVIILVIVIRTNITNNHTTTTTTNNNNNGNYKTYA